MIKNKILLLVAFLTSLVANNCTEDDFFISSSSTVNSNLSSIYLNVFDINTFNSNTEMFRLEIDRVSACTIDQQLELTVLYRFSSVVDGIKTIVVDGVLSISNITPNFIIIGNDLVLGNIFSMGASITDKSFTRKFSDSMQGSVFRSSSIPNGHYIVEFEIGSQILSRDIYVDSPDKIELLSPGAAETLNYSADIATLNPIFKWNADFCTNCKTGVRISRYRPDFHKNYYDAIDDISIVPFNQDGVYELENSHGSFMYPLTSPPLEYGAEYVWKVVREYHSSIGTIKQESDVFKFRVVSDSISDYNKDQLMEIIISIIGSEKFNDIFLDNEHNTLLYPYQSKVIVDGKELAIDELGMIINDIKTGRIKIKSIRLK